MFGSFPDGENMQPVRAALVLVEQGFVEGEGGQKIATFITEEV